jgi:hypothetical protein
MTGKDNHDQSVLKLGVSNGICDHTIHQFSNSFRNSTAGCVPDSLILFQLQYKAIPIQAWTDPSGFQRFRLPEFESIGYMKVVKLSAL